MDLIIVSISPKCIAVYYPFHECGISLKDKSENMQEIDNNQNEIILFPPSSLFINVGLKEITSAYANFLLFEIHQHRRMKSYQAISLRSKRFQSSYCAKVRAEAKKSLKGEGEGRSGNLHSPPPPPSFILFCSCPSFLDELREETLATQAIKLCPYWSSALRNQKN